MSTVDELLLTTVDNSRELLTPLRSAQVIASRLRLGAFAYWTRCELDGYHDDDSPPSYRQIIGRIVQVDTRDEHTLTAGQIPAAMESLIALPLRCSVVPIIEMLREKNLAHFAADIPPKVLAAKGLTQRAGCGNPYAIVTRASYALILNAVRSAIVDWGLRLSSLGIKGDGLTFSREEQDAAQRQAEALGPLSAERPRTSTVAVASQGAPLAGPVDLLTTDEAAKILRCSSKTITNLANRNQLKVVRVGRNVRIDRKELERFAAAGGAAEE